MLKLFGKDLLRYLPAQIMPAFLALISIPLYTRILSAEQFGQYALIQSSVHIMVTLLSWLRPAIIRFYPTMPRQDVSVLVCTALWTHLVLAGMLGVIAFILNRVLLAGTTLQPLVDIGIIIFILQSTSHLLAEILQARMQAGVYSIFMIWEQITGLGLGILLAVGLRHQVAGILWGSVLGTATALPFLWKTARVGIRTIGPISFPLLRELAWYGIPLMIGQLTAWVLGYADRYQIQLFYSAREVGIYAAAYTISQRSIAIVGALFRLSSGPLLANAWEKQGEKASMSFLHSVTRLYLLVGLPMVAGMSALAEPIMQVLTGPEFSDGYAIVPWVVGGAFFLGLQQRFNHALLLVKRTRIVMLWLIVSGLLNIGLNWWLLPIFGYKIAAVTTLMCYVFLCIVQALSSRRYLRWPFPWSTGVRSLLAAAAMCIGVSWLIHQVHLSSLGLLCLAIPVGVLLYGVSIWGLGELSSTERKAIEVYGRRWVNRRFGKMINATPMAED